MTAIPRPPTPDTLARVIRRGDLNDLADQERLEYYVTICALLGLSPETLPFSFYERDGRLHLYATKRCTQQLAKLYHVSIHTLESHVEDCILTFTAHASLPSGRQDTDVGSVDTAGLKGLDLANARMTAATKAKRRVTLSICGLGMLDETEVATIPGVTVHQVDHARLPRTPPGTSLSTHRTPDGPMSRTQLDDLTRALDIIGFDRREDARNFMQWLVGRSLETQKMLTAHEAANVLLRLGTYHHDGHYQPDEARIRLVYKAFIESQHAPGSGLN